MLVALGIQEILESQNILSHLYSDIIYYNYDLPAVVGLLEESTGKKCWTSIFNA